jgi:hypothetical protein
MRAAQSKPTSQAFSKRFCDTSHRYGAKLVAFMNIQVAKSGSAKAVGLLQDCVEYRLYVAGRGIDDLQHLSGRGLLLERLVALGSAFGKLTLQIGYELLGIG